MAKSELILEMIDRTVKLEGLCKALAIALEQAHVWMETTGAWEPELKVQEHLLALAKELLGDDCTQRPLPLIGGKALEWPTSWHTWPWG